MADPGQISGRYNHIIEGAYDAFDHQMPVDEFITRFKNDDVPAEVSVVGLGDAFEDATSPPNSLVRWITEQTI